MTLHLSKLATVKASHEDNSQSKMPAQAEGWAMHDGIVAKGARAEAGALIVLRLVKAPRA